MEISKTNRAHLEERHGVSRGVETNFFGDEGKARAVRLKKRKEELVICGSRFRNVTAVHVTQNDLEMSYWRKGRHQMEPLNAQ